MPGKISYAFVIVSLILVSVLLTACERADTQERGNAPQSSISMTDAETLPADRPSESLEVPPDVPEDMEIVWEVWNLLTGEHVDRSELDPEVFAEAAIEGLLSALDDPHTNYVGPEAFAVEREDIQGQFEGIGVTVSMNEDGQLIVIAPIEGGPAMNAGIGPGDVILEVNGESIADLSLLEIVALIRGPKDSKVVLLVQHLGHPDPVEITVTRGVIPIVSVLLLSEPGDRTAHVRITNFHAITAQELADMLERVLADGAEGIVLDVRNNPGGLLSSVVNVVSHFIEEGLIMYEVDGSGKRTDFDARGAAIAPDIPLVILANQFSASASEILVGALQDYQRATVVGTKTFGKGSVNLLKKLSNDGGLFITHARWFTPTGRLIEREGLQPDIEVAGTGDAEDAQETAVRQLEKAIEVLEAKLDGQSREGGN